jgi:hypothetical protein
LEENDTLFCFSNLQFRIERRGSQKSNGDSGGINEPRKKPTDVTSVAGFRRSLEPLIDYDRLILQSQSPFIAGRTRGGLLRDFSVSHSYLLSPLAEGSVLSGYRGRYTG